MNHVEQYIVDWRFGNDLEIVSVNTGKITQSTDKDSSKEKDYVNLFLYSAITK